MQYEEFQNFLNRTKPDDPSTSSSPQTAKSTAEPSITPDEQIAEASSILEESLRDALLTRILEGSPVFFEKMIIDLLLKMGYGGARADAGQQLGDTGDGGVDGIINEVGSGSRLSPGQAL